VIEVGGRRVKITTGAQTQTIRVLTAVGHNGKYEHVWRIAPPSVTQELIEEQRFFSVGEMGDWLEDEHGAVREEAGESAPKTPATVEAPPSEESAWFQSAVAATERAINQLALEFIEQPYLHRVEHSIHCRLFELLSSQQVFRRSIPVGKWETQPIHKEWPEYIPRKEKGDRRGAFDLAILSPERAKSLGVTDFRTGRVRPCIAIEMGLDYGLGHLDNDRRKLLNSGMGHGYLVHFVRQDFRDDFDAVERLVLGEPRAAYVHHLGTHARVKLLGDLEIREVHCR